VRRTRLPLLLLVPALAHAASVSPIEARAQVAPVALQDLMGHPDSFIYQQIRTRGVFVERGDLFNRHISHFQPGRYQNLILWSDRGALWDPEVRARPLMTAYVHTQSEANAVLGKLAKYQTVDITARVLAATDGEPWIEILEMTPVAGTGAFTDQSVYQIQQALTLSKEGAYDLADDHFAAALGSGLPAFARTTVSQQRAESLVLAGRYADALAQIDAAAAFAAADTGTTDVQRAAILATWAKVLIETAQGEVRTARLQDAVARASEAVALDPARGEPYAVLGIALAGLDRFDEARRQCDKAVRLRPQDAEVRWYLGRILDRQGKHDEAIEALKKAIDLTPKDHRMHKAIANAYANRGAAAGAEGAADLFTAIREYDITLRLNPQDAEAHVLAGRAILVAAAASFEVPAGGERRPATQDLALERYKAALAIDPKNLAANEALADFYIAKGQPADAEPYLAGLAAAEPDSLARVTALADLQWSVGRKTQAVASLDAWAKAHPKHAPVRVALAKRQIELGDDAGAKASLEETLRIDPKHSEAQGLLAAVNARLKAGAAPVRATPAAKPAEPAKPAAEAPTPVEAAKPAPEAAKSAAPVAAPVAAPAATVAAPAPAPAAPKVKTKGN
jgi:tetratricopeptide (TPR) repeat protein